MVMVIEPDGTTRILYHRTAFSTIPLRGGERQWGFTHAGTFIVDPRYDETYRFFDVSPDYYGLSTDERSQLIRLNRLDKQ